MKKPITLLIALSLVGITGCSSAKQVLAPKGIKMNNGAFRSELLAKLDEFIEKYRFVETRDAEDVRDDFVFTHKVYSNYDMTATISTGTKQKVKQHNEEVETVKFDSDSNYTSIENETEEEYSMNKVDEYSETRITDEFYTAEYKFDNIEMTRVEANEDLPLMCFFDETEDISDMIVDLRHELQTSEIVDYDTYKNGNIYTYYVEKDANELMTGASGKEVEARQITVNKKSISFLSYYSADASFIMPDTGATMVGDVVEVEYWKLAQKNNKLKAPNTEKYREIVVL